MRRALFSRWWLPALSAVALVTFLGFLLTLQNPDQRRLQFYLSRTMTPDISYCHGQTLDFYAPRQKAAVPSPLVLYIHGGGWLINDKQSDPDQMMRMNPLLDQNVAFASINYRSLPIHHFPAPLEDALCAVRFLRTNATRFNIDENRIAVFGNSAGGTIAAMVGVLGGSDAFRTEEYPNVSSAVDGVVTVGGQMDFEREVSLANRARTRWFTAGYDGDIKPFPAANVTRTTPPFMLIHGRQDDTVSFRQAELMADALQAKGVPHRLLVVDNADHGLHPEGGIPRPNPDDINKRIQVFLMTQLQ